MVISNLLGPWHMYSHLQSLLPVAELRSHIATEAAMPSYAHKFYLTYIISVNHIFCKLYLLFSLSVRKICVFLFYKIDLYVLICCYLHMILMLCPWESG